MWSVALVFYTLCVVLSNVSLGADLPHYIKPCSIADPEKFNECFIKHGNEAIPYLINGDKNFKVPSLDPLKIDKVEFSPGPQLTITAENVEVFGLKEASIISGSYELGEGENGQMIFRIFVPNVTIAGDYIAKGRILILPIEGKGRMNMQIIKVIFNYTLEFENMRFESTKPLKLKGTDTSFYQENVVFKFDNLFNGNKLLSDETNKVLTENWRAVHEDLSPVFGATIDTIVKSIVVGTLEKFYFKQAFLP